MKRKGLTLTELLVALVISLFLLFVIYLSYVFILQEFFKGTGRTSVTISSIVGEEILRQDIEHAGYGISIKEPKVPIQFKKDSNGRPVLTMRSTYVVSRRSTKGWAILNCPSAGTKSVLVSYSQLPLPSPYAVVMDLSETVVSPHENIGRNGQDYNCPKQGYFMAYPVPDNDTISDNDTICLNQVCAQIDYYLSTSSAVNPVCKDMPALMRRVSWKRNLSSGQPFLGCVADFQVRIDWGNRKYVDPYDTSDPDYSEIQSATFEDLREKLKMVHVYLLVREGDKDLNYEFTGSTKVEPDNVELHLPSDYKHYHWKIVKLSIEPINIIRK